MISSRITRADAMSVVRIAGVCISVLLLAWASWTCKDEVDGAGSDEILFPDSNVSYGKQVEPLLNLRCGAQSSQCHAADTYTNFGEFSLDTYQHLRNRIDIVVPCFPNLPCNPELSILVRRIEGLDGNQRMPPPSSPPLTSNQINGARQWIREGARNN